MPYTPKARRPNSSAATILAAAITILALPILLCCGCGIFGTVLSPRPAEQAKPVEVTRRPVQRVLNQDVGERPRDLPPAEPGPPQPPMPPAPAAPTPTDTPPVPAPVPAAVESSPAPATPRKPPAEMRTWTDATGAYTVLASLVTLSNGQVTLLKEDGAEAILPLARLSAADREFVRSRWVEGKVVAITDGDTIQVLVDERPVKIRLEGIDCPESGQPFGTAARKHTASLCFSEHARVRVTGQDKYGRTLGEVLVGKESVNRSLVRNGFAWHYKKYSSDEELAASEIAARKAKAGLWADANPIPPWEWRDLSASERAARVAKAAPRDIEPRGPPTRIIPAVPTAPQGSHWITTSSGIRHNSSCRYYENSKGRHCGPTEGRACKICGG